MPTDAFCEYTSRASLAHFPTQLKWDFVEFLQAGANVFVDQPPDQPPQVVPNVTKAGNLSHTWPQAAASL
jgi:hypothetical protein